MKDFRPINPWGRKAPMPAGWESPLRKKLYRVAVEERGRREPIFVSPAVLRQDAEEFAQAIRTNIQAGLENDWINPTVIEG